MRSKEKFELELDQIKVGNKEIILWNDNVNTFDHVIDCLVEFCEHSIIQAEQCAYIVHHNGKCMVKRGNQEELKPIARALSQKGLTVEIK